MTSFGDADRDGGDDQGKQRSSHSLLERPGVPMGQRLRTLPPKSLYSTTICLVACTFQTPQRSPSGPAMNVAVTSQVPGVRRNFWSSAKVRYQSALGSFPLQLVDL